MAYSGKIGRRKARLRRDADDHLVLDWRGKTFDLERVVVRHRDDEGTIEFSVCEPDGDVTGVHYTRRGPTLRDKVLDAIDVTADEPWTWEDADFGLLVFHEATGTGPVKYRHRFQPHETDHEAIEREMSLAITDDAIVRTRYRGRREEVRFEELREIRVKFELSGSWAPSSVLVLTTKSDLLAFPLPYGGADTQRCETDLLPRLRRLPGWDEKADAGIADAIQYASRQSVGPKWNELPGTRAERSIWALPADPR